MKARKKSYRDEGKDINPSSDLREALEILANEVARVLDLKGSAIRLLDLNRRTPELVTPKGIKRKYIRKGFVDADQSISGTNSNPKGYLSKPQI